MLQKECTTLEFVTRDISNQRESGTQKRNTDCNNEASIILSGSAECEFNDGG